MSTNHWLYRCSSIVADEGKFCSTLPGAGNDRASQFSCVSVHKTNCKNAPEKSNKIEISDNLLFIFAAYIVDKMYQIIARRSISTIFQETCKKCIKVPTQNVFKKRPFGQCSVKFDFLMLQVMLIIHRNGTISPKSFFHTLFFQKKWLTIENTFKQMLRSSENGRNLNCLRRPAIERFQCQHSRQAWVFSQSFTILFSK